jgi:hypothetical protein
MKRIKFSTNELFFDTDKSYWLLNYSDNSIKVFNKDHFSFKKDSEFKNYRYIIINELSINSLKL